MQIIHGSMCPRPGHLHFFLGGLFPTSGHTEGDNSPIPHLFERLFLVSWENNRDCHISMRLSLKTMEVQIKGDHWNKRFRTVQVYWIPHPRAPDRPQIRFCYTFFLRTKAKRNVFTTFINVFWVYKLFSKLLRQG